MSLSEKLRERFRQIGSFEQRFQAIQESLGRIESRQLRAMPPADLQASEFRVFSQWGEDGIIQHLISQIAIERRIFVEFGVENYTEASTRFLLINNNWSGLVIDGGASNIDYIRNDPIYWRHNLKAELAFITRDNINDLIARNGIRGEIGLLSVDIDGNDYWVWQAIDVISPVVVIAEYNARFGATAAVTVPYDAGFVRSKAHHSMVYYGASLSALARLAQIKGYSLVGCNSAGNNAFFVRHDKLPAGMPAMTPQEAYVRNQFRESRDAAGQLSFVAPEMEHSLLKDLPLVDVSQ